MERWSDEQGLALIVAVIILLVFAIMAVVMAALVSTDSDISLYQFRSGEALYIANAGMQYAMRFGNAQVGTGTISSAGTTVTGAGTLFTTELQPGSKIIANGQSRTVISIASAISLTVDTAFAPALPGGTAFSYTFIYPNFSIPPNSIRGGTPQVNFGSGGFTVDPVGVLSVGINNVTTASIPAVCFDKGVAVGCNTLFPSPGRILIESELINYTGVGAASFGTVSVTRGTGGSLAAAHAINAGIHHATAVTGGAGGIGTIVGTADATINVSSTVGFVIPGTIKIDHEYLYCTGTGGTTSFTGCARGQQGSQATQHNVSGNPAGSPGATAVQLTVTVRATVSTGLVGNAQRILKGEEGVYLDGWAVGNDVGPGLPDMARWNGINFDDVTPAGISEDLNSVFMLDINNDGSADDGWAVGDDRAGAADSLMLRWNGVSWSVVNPGVDENLYSVYCVASNDCWTVGTDGTGAAQSPLILWWNGVTWTTRNTGFSGINVDLNSVYCVATNDCWTVGEPSGGELFLHWDGAMWTRNGPYGGIPNVGLNSVFCVSSTDCWVVGDDTGGGGATEVIANWNGATWTRVGPSGAIPNENLNSVFCVSSTDCWIVGNDDNNGTADDGELILRWNGLAWTRIPQSGTIPNVDLNSVYCVSSVDCWAGGDVSGGTTLIIHWDGANWSRYSSPTANQLNEVFMVRPQNFVRLADWQEVY